MRVGVVEHFDSMHFLPGNPYCGVPHGHTYRVDLALEGPVRDGIVMDFGILRSVLREVLRDFDHVDLNRVLPYPSCENLAAELLRRLKERIPGGRLTVRVWEGEGKWAEAEG